jgi:DNA-binding winged helix-turn-helix (wHTH) protein
MGDPRWHSEGVCGQRSWSFADCTFDEANWTLTVASRRVAVETKPLEILRQLLLRPGQVVSKAELLDAIWPDIVVVEASLPTAVHKLRTALGDDGRDAPIVETVPRIGYRLSVPAEIIVAAPDAARSDDVQWLPFKGWSERARLAAVALIAAFLASAAFALVDMSWDGENAKRNPSIAQVDRALRTLDVDRIDGFIAAGWDVNMVMDGSRNTPLNRLLDMCEWDPAHDRRRMLLMARTLVDAGTRLTDRNTFGDTPYSIAKTPRFCGADHPVTLMLKNLCYNGDAPRTHGDRCLASYELKRMASRN